MYMCVAMCSLVISMTDDVIACMFLATDVDSSRVFTSSVSVFYAPIIKHSKR